MDTDNNLITKSIISHMELFKFEKYSLWNIQRLGGIVIHEYILELIFISSFQRKYPFTWGIRINEYSEKNFKF